MKSKEASGDSTTCESKQIRKTAITSIQKNAKNIGKKKKP